MSAAPSALSSWLPVLFRGTPDLRDLDTDVEIVALATPQLAHELPVVARSLDDTGQNAKDGSGREYGSLLNSTETGGEEAKA